MSASVRFASVIERDKDFGDYKVYDIEVVAEVCEGIGYELFASVDPFVRVRKVTFQDGKVYEPQDMLLELTAEECAVLEPEALRRL